MRVDFPSGASTMLLAAGLAAAIVSCGPTPRAGEPAAAPPPAPAPSSTVPAPTPDQRICRAYAQAAPSARTPLDAMRTQAVLVPFINLIQLGTNQIAARAGDANSPAVAQAMRELVAAQEDIDRQGNDALRGADIAETPVRLDPTRLTAALDAADQACLPHLTR